MKVSMLLLFSINFDSFDYSLSFLVENFMPFKTRTRKAVIYSSKSNFSLLN